MREKLIPIAKIDNAIRRIERRGTVEDRDALSAALKLPFEAIQEGRGARGAHDGKVRSREAIMAIDVRIKARRARTV